MTANLVLLLGFLGVDLERGIRASAGVESGKLHCKGLSFRPGLLQRSRGGD